ncbi:MAG: tyrosine-type recombinase/integrase [Pseudomonadota bacterium]
MSLTARQVSTAPTKDRPYKLADARGLYLYVGPTGLKSWRANYKNDAKQATRTYGRFPDVSLADARRLHADASDGAMLKVAPTFKEVMTQWLKVKLPTLSNDKHKGQVRGTLEEHALPKLGAMRVDAIKRADVVVVVRAVEAKGLIETAHRVAGRVCMVLNYAVDEGHIESHPAAGITRVITERKRQKPMASIDPALAPQLMAAIETYDEPVTRLGLHLMAHTFVRVGELRGMKWSELVKGDPIWVVPAERMKLRLPHVVPLSEETLRLLKELHAINGTSEYVLQSPLRPGHPISENTLLFALYRLGYRKQMTAHGFRALASTVLNGAGKHKDAIERQLAHKETDEVRAAYNRAEYLPERRELMGWWSSWLLAQRPKA